MADLLSSLQSAAGVSTGNPNAWDISKAYYDPGSAAGDISKGIPTRTISVNTEQASPSGLFFKPDGTKMYVFGTTSVSEYTLSSAWDLATTTYIQAFDTSAQEATGSDIYFKPDGTKMYITGSTNDSVYEYSLSTPWDVSTASYVQAFSVASEELAPLGLFFKPDGTKMYVVGLTGDDVNEYGLSSAWDISTASYVQNFSVAAQDVAPRGVAFLEDGTKMYVVGSVNDKIYQYDLSTAWDISTASYVQDILATLASEILPNAIYVRPNGEGICYVGTSADTVSYLAIGGFRITTQDSAPGAIFFRDDGLKMYMTGSGFDYVNEYDLSIAWDINTATFLQQFYVNAQEGSPQGLFFKPDGTKMYICGLSGDEVNEYNLSVAWDVSTASFVQLFSILSQENISQGLFFKPDGTKMYITGSAGDSVYEYSLSTPWDISTASYVQNFSVATEGTYPNDIFFKDDGKKMYIVDLISDSVNEYDLSTAWDISTASFLQSYSVITEEGSVSGFFFKPDGTQFFIVGTSTDRVLSYKISEE
jgi:DNA-binding beta-propeller fold protein YncE